MATKIRLARGGSKNRPFYRIVVANSRAPRDGDFIEKLGTYNPLLPKDDKTRISMKLDRVSYWLSQGAQPSDKVANFIEKADITLPNFIKKASARRTNGNNIRLADKVAKKETTEATTD